jgi:hypothetical protein
MKILFASLIIAIGISVSGQNANVPALIKLKDGKTIDAKHFGQFKCGDKSILIESYIIVRGKYMGSVTEVKTYGDIERIVPVGFNSDPANSVGNEKSQVKIYKKDGVIVMLDDAEFAMSCYGPEDKYNTIVVQIFNPLTNKVAETTINTNEISSIIFK